MLSLAEQLRTLAGTLDEAEQCHGRPQAVLALAVLCDAQAVSVEVASLIDAYAVTLADSGQSLAVIGRALGVSRQRAGQRVTRARNMRETEWASSAPRAAVTSDRDGYAAACHAAYEAAEDRCRGYGVNRAGQARRIALADFYRAHGRRPAERYASEELVEHWAESGKPPLWSEWSRRATA